MKKIILIFTLTIIFTCFLPLFFVEAQYTYHLNTNKYYTVARLPYRYVKVEGRQLLVDFDRNGVYEPYLIKGVGYSPFPVGRHPSDWGPNIFY